jgi:mono/diheme cytochrome c family protein
MFLRLTIPVLLVSAAFSQSRPAWDGVFNAAQAARGAAVYRESCARCHGQDLSGGENSPALAGAGFLARWSGKSAADFLERTRRTMPTDNPGGLTAAQYAGVVATSWR